MENVGFTEVCVTLDSTPTSEVNVALETDDTPTGAQGKLLYLHARKLQLTTSPLVYDSYDIFPGEFAQKHRKCKTEVYGNIY